MVKETDMIAKEYSNSRSLTDGIDSPMVGGSNKTVNSYGYRCGEYDAKTGHPFAPESWVADWYGKAAYTNGFLAVQPDNAIAAKYLHWWVAEELLAMAPSPSYVVNGEWVDA
jgi:hypothetical protein